MKKTKKILLLALTVFIVAMSFFVPGMIFNLQDRAEADKVATVKTELIDYSGAGSISLIEKLNLIHASSTSSGFESGNFRNSDEAGKAAINDFLYFLEEMQIADDALDGNYNCSVKDIVGGIVMGSDNKGFAIWDVLICAEGNYSGDVVYSNVILDDETGKILAMYIFSDDKVVEYDSSEYGEIPEYEGMAEDYDALMMIAEKYVQYLNIDETDIDIVIDQDQTMCVDVYCKNGDTRESFKVCVADGILINW